MLKEQKVIYGGLAVIALGIGGAFYAASGGDNDNQIAQKPTERHERVVKQQVQEPIVRRTEPRQAEPRRTQSDNPVIAKFGGTNEDPCGHLEGNTKKDCNKMVFSVRDPSVLRSQGFSGTMTLNDFGRVCEANGTVSGNWKGSASSVSYSGNIDGKKHNICINHSGKASNPAIGTGPVLVETAARPAAPAVTETLASIAAGFGGTEADPCGHLDGDSKKGCNRAVIDFQDQAILKAQDLQNTTNAGYGRVCDANGTVSGKWKGSASFASYTGTMNGQAYNICIEHSGKASKPKIGTGPVLAQ